MSCKYCKNGRLRNISLDGEKLKANFCLMCNEFLGMEDDSENKKMTFVECVAISKEISENKKTIQEERSTFDNLEFDVTKIMHDIGVPAHIKGYQYMREAIIMAVNNPTVLNKITKILYPTIANKYQATPSQVERAIRHAIEIARSRKEVDIVNEMLGYTINNEKDKLTNSEFIASIADKMRLEYKKAQ